ncbi:hypothetical protein EPK99_09245 [Neorhizobium lilium]|uniref:Polysaccharide biosynthesis enzyme WcbI domain-containing protein n=1 Tax=Neorhizobium lilium TaxID=2503024 RepID=A0A3S4UQI6_9HYPH|nr:hypothetical protein [Neorhizobium lilium]RWX78764.1 hypothetical protein EPK99_09245 [Neorhizobium lilium]
MKIFFYGGCHAQVFARVFREWGSADVCDVVVNYELIASNLPFPYERLHNYDAVVFSPINNKDEYNTKYIEDYCNKHGIKSISYPWMQWNGYHPFTEKREFLGLNHWFPVGHDLEPDQARIEIVKSAEITTDRLKQHEETNRTNLKISDFILKYYRDTRLFLTPDHPSNVLYRYAVWEISKRLSIDVSHDFYRYEQLLQPEIILPIQPAVSAALDLRFEASDEYRFDAAGGTFKMYGPEYAKFGQHLNSDALRVFSRSKIEVIDYKTTESDDFRPQNDPAVGSSLIGRVVSDEGSNLVVEFLAAKDGIIPDPTIQTIKDSEWKVSSRVG